MSVIGRKKNCETVLTDWLTELINNKAVCRTAPATPSLLKINQSSINLTCIRKINLVMFKINWWDHNKWSTLDTNRSLCRGQFVSYMIYLTILATLVIKNTHYVWFDWHVILISNIKHTVMLKTPKVLIIHPYTVACQMHVYLTDPV